VSRRALVLAAHGSRQDPAANALIRRLAQAVRARRLFDEVAVGFHQGEPRFDAVLDELASDAATVVPVMTSAGHFSRRVLPAALARNRRYASLRLALAPALGTHSAMASLVARRISALLREHRLGRETTSLLLVGHGTPRHAASRDSTLRLSAALEARGIAGQVVAGFFDDDPGIPAAAAVARLDTVIVLPFLIGGGAHVIQDLPAALAPAMAAGRRILIDRPIGESPGLVDLIVDLARRHPPPARAAPSSSPVPRRRGPAGGVHLVGAGPGDPGLITARGLDLLRRADVVIHDRLVGPELLHEARADAELLDVGKGPGLAPLGQAEINRLLVNRARRGLVVVRLKGGDPFVFGRGSEELAACRAAGIACDVVPGVSSAIAGPAAAGIPVTARGVARSFAVITAHHARGEGEADPAPVAAVDTIVVLMGRAALGRFAERLVAAGRHPDTPAACVQSATTLAQRVTVATLGTIAAAAERDGLESPVVTVIGKVVAEAQGAALAPWLDLAVGA
jgi:uroporphyrin-III C-methyltransferase